MPLLGLPLELLLMIAHLIRDDHGKLRYGDFNSFLQVNRALYACLNRMLWTEAGEHEVDTQRVLTHLIQTNNLASLEFFLELGADVEVRLPITVRWVHKSTLLLIAAHLDNIPMARLLLENGAKVQYSDQDESKTSPLHAARSAEMVQLLLDHDADPDLDDDLQRRPLQWYVIRNDIASMRTILQHGAEVRYYENPLHEAARRNLDTVKLLLEHGADIEGRDLEGNTALHWAAAQGKSDVVRFLVEKWPEGKKALTNEGKTPLLMYGFILGHTGKSDEVKEMLDPSLL
jgi:ankyrin repeat protein